jgi:transaldolase/glucose-6-phosphate isomerase
MSTVRSLGEYGQSVWLDYIQRNLLVDGSLKRLIRQQGVSGVTTNPAIFEKAIAASDDYALELQALAADDSLDTAAIYEHLVLGDVQRAADVLRPTYDVTSGRDGYVSVEVSPKLAYETEATCTEARRLWESINRANVMIKVPATEQGVSAIEALLSEGINVNATLLFARSFYARVAEAYQRGVERFAAAGGDVSKLASVASFFVSRIDIAVDKLIANRINKFRGDDRALLQQLQGRVAVANARLAYQHYKVAFDNARWNSMAARGAQPQRLLWASTSSKNPAYPDVIYVEELIGANTVTTLPPQTLEAFLEHGNPRASLEDALDDAHDVLASLDTLDILFDAVTDQLLDDGVRLFAEAYDRSLGAVTAARNAA